ncbi:MAG: DNA mismatch repair protein MutS [Anaeroplasmataceae bacterium]|nr:DNA mismatch repair protein MutS [Anaeroplasmataceae bacterium]MDE6413798.1 DNA mismatch repair protein MutS [Anaeroplasmataceae bacterium]
MKEKEVKYTPMMEQYLEIKKDYPDTILFYRVGDFYEMFFEDAHTGAKELELALTGKDAGVEERVPMCGVPFHAYEPYAERLISKGYKVAIVEQVEDPKAAKGIVKRGVVKIITPGTLDSGLNDKENNYIAGILQIKRDFVLCYCDLSTGEGYITKLNSFEVLANEILSLHIKEIVIDSKYVNQRLSEFVKQNQIVLSHVEEAAIPPTLIGLVSNIEEEYHPAVGVVLHYFMETKKQMPTHLKPVQNYIHEQYLHIDAFTKKNLELCETLRYNNKSGSLLWHLDHCETAMGSRMLHKWLDKPLLDSNAIQNRLDFIECFNHHYLEKAQIKEYFKSVYDLERIIGRIASGNANAKDLVWLRKSLQYIPQIKDLIHHLDLVSAQSYALEILDHQELYSILFKALVDNPPLSIKEGGMIKEGFDEKLDEIKSILANSKEWILNYEKSQKELTGIKTLKVGYNRVTGYYIEVSKGAIANLPEDIGYERRATLANAERFISKELKEYEDIVLHSNEQIVSLEYEIFSKLRSIASSYIVSLQNLADHLATIDCYIALSDVAVKYNYVRPTFNTNRKITIVDGRHPVLETIMKSGYIVNDVEINTYNMMLITGPNMSGKSTYMRMLATIAILAQIGSFVPAKAADLMIFDAIYTRIGASDDLVSGQSTFMVEMMEANYAITNATKDSLILFDEIGRGTATYDGMALAQAILEYVHERIGCVTLFSTHYHELTVLDQKLKRLKNVHVEAKETDQGVAFLHKVLDGPTDKSYGINVASLAGLPKSLIARSKMILDTLEEESNTNKGVSMDLFNFLEYDSKEEVQKETRAEKTQKRLDEIDLNCLTPLDALKLLYELKEE